MMENGKNVPVFLGMLKHHAGGICLHKICARKSPTLAPIRGEFVPMGKKTPVESPPLQETILKISGLSKSELAAFDANVHGPIESLGMFDVLQVPECRGKPSAFG